MLRRDFLGGAFAVAGGAVLSGCTSENSEDPPQRQALTVRDKEINRLSGEHYLAGVDIGPDAVLEFDPEVSTTLVVTGNVIVRGVLRMRPATADVVHTIRFRDIDEEAFVGDTMDPVDSDVGVWVVERGSLDLRGTARTGWNRTGWDRSWRDDDEVVRAPQAAGDFATYRTMGRHESVPRVVGPDGAEYRTEVLNLTRNVVIEGAPQARAHVFIRSEVAQSIRYALFRWMGPRHALPGLPRYHHAGRQLGRFGTGGEIEYPQGQFSATRFPESAPVLGRYPVHFHHCEDGSRGSVVEGCVVRNSSRAFVPHSSHGITMRDCIAFDIIDDAFWWDEEHPTDDLVWDHCGAFGIRFDPVTAGSPAAFVLGQGQRPVIRDCVAVGVRGGGGADAGFLWPAFANMAEDNVWQSSDLVAHNCYGAGVYVWQDDDNRHVVERLVSYRNGGEGLVHGARRNAYRYDDVVLFDNGGPDLLHQAVNRDDPNLRQHQSWTRLVAPYVFLGDHLQSSELPIEFHDSRIDRLVVDEVRDGSGIYVFHADLDESDVTVESQRSLITIVRSDGSTFDVGRARSDR
jgi:hypothetical protein